MVTQATKTAPKAPHDPLLPRRAVELPTSAAPRLFVVVDTEEEFDWQAPYSRTHTKITAIKHVHRAQRLFDRYAIKPIYVIDYPVASQADGYRPLFEILQDGRCDIGAHLHPWVNPPFAEPVTRRNSFTCNLPVDLQRDKLTRLSETIESRFGSAPKVFKAGRYGLGATTVELLEELGFEVDASVCPRMDFSEMEGPSFSAFDCRPFFLTERLLEIPCTVDYTGWAGSFSPALHRIAGRSTLARAHAVGLLARTGVVNQVMLSPEGYTLNEMRTLTRSLISRGLRTLTLSFHSPSVEPGHTPYVRTSAQLARFLETIEGYCDFFVNEVRGVPTTMEAFRASVVSPTESET